MNSFERRNAHFDRLFATKNLYWLGQNTNHLPMHTAVRKALLASIGVPHQTTRWRHRAERRLASPELG